MIVRMAPLCRSAAIKSFGQFELALPASVQQRQVNLLVQQTACARVKKADFIQRADKLSYAV